MTYACEKKRDTLCFLGVVVEKDHWEMASKAYVASMTVTELKQELKQRGLSTRGSKKSLRDRLERVTCQILSALFYLIVPRPTANYIIYFTLCIFLVQIAVCACVCASVRAG